MSFAIPGRSGLCIRPTLQHSPRRVPPNRCPSDHVVLREALWVALAMPVRASGKPVEPLAEPVPPNRCPSDHVVLREALWVALAMPVRASGKPMEPLAEPVPPRSLSSIVQGYLTTPRAHVQHVRIILARLAGVRAARALPWLPTTPPEVPLTNSSTISLRRNSRSQRERDLVSC